MEPPKGDREDDAPPGGSGAPPPEEGASPEPDEGDPMYRRRGRLESPPPVEDAVPLGDLPSCPSNTGRCEARLDMGVTLRITRRMPQATNRVMDDEEEKDRSERLEALATVVARSLDRWLRSVKVAERVPSRNSGEFLGGVGLRRCVDVDSKG